MSMRIGVLDPKEDLYALLGVAPDATAAAIQKAHRRLARAHHPDVVGVRDEQAMKRINFAASVLLDPDARARYDRGRLVPKARPARPATPSWPDYTPHVTPADLQPIPQPTPFGDWFQSASAWMRKRERFLVLGAVVAPVILIAIASAIPGPVPVASSDYKLPAREPTVMTTYLNR